MLSIANSAVSWSVPRLINPVLYRISGHSPQEPERGIWIPQSPGSPRRQGDLLPGAGPGSGGTRRFLLAGPGPKGSCLLLPGPEMGGFSLFGC